VEPDSRIYRISPWRRAVLWCVLGPFLALGVALVFAGGNAATRTAGIVLVAIMALGLAGWEWLVNRTYVEVTAEGVELHQLGLHLRAAWSDVAALSLRRGREGFIVRAPLSGAGPERLAALRHIGAFGAPLYDDEQNALLRAQRFIPIDAFGWHLRHGTLVQEVARLAPHVRIGGEPAASARASASGLVLAAVIIAVAIGLGLSAPDYAAAPLIVLGSGVNAFRTLRSRSLLVGGLFVAFTLVTLGWTVIAWIELAQWLDS
jgi:hypothetical protein